MLNVVCVNHGNYQGQGADYVNRLYAMVARNLDKGTEGKFVCFTDDATGLNPAIHAEPLPLNVPGWWNKLYLFAPGLFRRDDRVLYLDLDTVIVGPLDEIAAYDGDFAILRDFYRLDGLQSSVMAWHGGFGAHLWHEWNRQNRPEVDGGDQIWIEQHLERAPGILQEQFPDSFVSYKRDCHPYPPESARVVVFHGEPRPHECGQKWVKEIWTEADGGGFSVALVRNTHLDVVRRQSKQSAALNLPRLISKPAHDGHVAIVGGGPSLKRQIGELKARAQHGCAIWALNNSYDWLRENVGIIPDAHVVLDAREQNVTFLNNARAETIYYLASQCHPQVYSKLRGHKIVRFDIDVMGDCGTTVGTYAMAVAFVEGFRNIHLYGFDSSYEDATGHAYPQELNEREPVVTVNAGDREFRAAPWMFQQAKDFTSLVPDMLAHGATVTVHGDGLIPYLAQQMAMPRAAQIRAKEVLARLPEGPVYGAEIGVFAGEMSAALLERENLDLHLVDSWEGAGAAYKGNAGDWHSSLEQAEQNEFRERAERAVAFAGGRAHFMPVRSEIAAQATLPGSLDFVFIDADHSYEGCLGDIVAWVSKLKLGGLLCGHDYDNPDFPQFGVKRAVDEFAQKLGKPVELGDNCTWFIRL